MLNQRRGSHVIGWWKMRSREASERDETLFILVGIMLVVLASAVLTLL